MVLNTPLEDNAAISSAKESDATIVGVHSDTSFSAFSAIRAPYFQRKNGQMRHKE